MPSALIGYRAGGVPEPFWNCAVKEDFRAFVRYPARSLVIVLSELSRSGEKPFLSCPVIRRSQSC